MRRRWWALLAGAPFLAGRGTSLDEAGSRMTRGGPDPANGYTVIEAANLHDAVVLAKGCPGLSSGGSVKVYEAMQMG